MGHNFKFEVIPLAEAVGESRDGMTGSALARPVVLVVDDEPLIVDSLAVILGTAGFAVFKAYDGAAALEAAISSPPHLLLTDVAMPGMNGIDLAMAVADALPDTRVLLFSAHASSLDLTAARLAGFDFPLMAKPMHPREMLKRVSAILYGDSDDSRIRNANGQKTGPYFWQPPLAAS